MWTNTAILLSARIAVPTKNLVLIREPCVAYQPIEVSSLCADDLAMSRAIATFVIYRQKSVDSFAATSTTATIDFHDLCPKSVILTVVIAGGQVSAMMWANVPLAECSRTIAVPAQHLESGWIFIFLEPSVDSSNAVTSISSMSRALAIRMM